MTELDPSAVLTALGSPEPSSVVRIVGGADAQLWRITLDGADYALRILRPDQAAQARRELAALATATAAGLPVPSVAAMGTWREHPVQLLTWSPGTTLAQILHSASRDPAHARELGLAFGRMQAAIHTLPIPEEIAAHPVNWVDWAGEHGELREQLTAILDPRVALLHLDYHPMNVLVEDDRISAVLDWANARPGDARADIARTFAILELVPLPAGAVEGSRQAFISGWWEGYSDEAGPIDHLAPFCWWAGEVMIRDLEPHLERSNLLWLTPIFLDHVRSWTASWRERTFARSGS